MKHLAVRLVALTWLSLGLVGCSEKKPTSQAKLPEQAASTNAPDTNGMPEPVAATSEAKPAGPPVPAADQQLCFQCEGTGQMTCHHTGCDHGFVECPGPCLKRSSKWEHAQVDGHPPETLWHVIPLGGGHEQLVSQAHIGEVFVVRNGQVDRLGKCKVCNGTCHLPCPTCGGKAKVVCDLCEGRKVAFSQRARAVKNKIF